MKRGALAAAVLALAWPSAEAAAQSTTPVTEVMFSPATSGFSSAMKTKLIEFIHSATTSIDIACYAISDADVIAALNNKSPAVTVRIVTDQDNIAGLSTLEGGIQVRDDGGDPDEMHHKFVVVDGTAVWTGSANFNSPNLVQMNNNAVIVRDATIAAAYQAEFNRMFTSGQFKEAKTGVLTQSVTTGNQTVEARFAPTDGVADRIVALLNAAQSSIYFAAFTYNHSGAQGSLSGIAGAMRDRAATGLVTVKGAFDADQAATNNVTKFDELNGLEPGPASNIDVRTTKSAAGDDMHHKFIVIDRRIVITGSFNFTSAADQNNDENIVVITDTAIADRYIQELNRILGTNFESLGVNDPNTTTVSGAGSGTSDTTTSSDTSIAGGGGHPEPRAYPNPLVPGSTMTFTTSTRTAIRQVRIYSSDRRLVRTILGGNATAVSWDGRNDRGDALASGTYLFEIDTADGRVVGHLTLIR